MELNIAQHVFSSYFEKGQVIECSVVKGGLINQTYKLDTSEGVFILQEINQQVFLEPKLVLENIKRVSLWLNEHEFNYGFPAPIQFNHVFSFGKLWRLLPFIEGNSHNEISNKKMVENATICLSNFYCALEQFPIQDLHVTIPHFHHGQFYIDELFKAIERSNSKRKEQAFQEIRDIKLVLDDLVHFDEVVNQLPKRVIHYDTKINNFLFDENFNVKALIDLDTLMPGSILSDVGDMIRTYSNKLGEESTDFDLIQADPETIDTIVEIISKNTLLTELEKNHLYFAGKAITLMQCVRFLTDFLKGDVYYTTTHPIHNLNRAKNQFILYDSMNKE